MGQKTHRFTLSGANTGIICKIKMQNNEHPLLPPSSRASTLALFLDEIFTQNLMATRLHTASARISSNSARISSNLSLLLLLSLQLHLLMAL